MKLFEDEILYDEIRDWGKIGDFFTTVLVSEESFGISRENIKMWHAALREYLKRTPAKESRANFIKNINLPLEMSEEINSLISIIKENDEIKQVLQDLYRSFFTLV